MIKLFTFLHLFDQILPIIIKFYAFGEKRKIIRWIKNSLIQVVSSYFILAYIGAYVQFLFHTNKKGYI